MRPTRFVIAALAALLGAAISINALAQPRGGPPRGGGGGGHYSGGYHGGGGHYHGGVYLGLGLGWPYWGGYWAGYPYWGYPYYPPYGERIVVVPSEPSVYVEQPRAQGAPESGYWYYCAGASAYYPYVKECPGGWQRVPPRPPGE